MKKRVNMIDLSRAWVVFAYDYPVLRDTTLHAAFNDFLETYTAENGLDWREVADRIEKVAEAA